MHDYVKKNNFEKVLIGISGGIDSALVACLAVDALGAQNVKGLFMPTRYTAHESRHDAEALAKNLRIELLNIQIETIFEESLRALEPIFKKSQTRLAEENLQARIRANLWMALSNKFGWLVLTTGNKSELSVGYSTLYGDMAGGFSVLKDIYKTKVYELAKYRNGVKSDIPQNIIDRAPTAELRFDQTDEADLPAPYCELDRILKLYVEDDCSLEEMISAGHKEAVVRKIITLVDRNEYKRRQSPIGIKVTARAFGRDRRMPITNGYRS
jgi:NAD+ synthase (glutamine-hydrolysing)